MGRGREVARLRGLAVLEHNRRHSTDSFTSRSKVAWNSARRGEKCGLTRISHVLTGVVGTLLPVESPSPPRFLAGEKVPKADEGAFHAYVIRTRELNGAMLPPTPSSDLGPASVNREYHVYAPLIRLRHLLPPQKTAGGEGLSTRGVVVLQECCEKCGLTYA
jgi:hypothetical protein